MKIGIIGAGNMGGAIARGIAAHNAGSLTVCSPNRHGELDALKAEFPAINVSLNNADAVDGSDAIIVAVKPWLLDEVMHQLAPVIDWSRQMLISIVAGASLERLAAFADSEASRATVMQLIPNTAIAVGQGMTFITARSASHEQLSAVEEIFGTMGKTMVIDEREMPACMALASCGIAYALRYIRAASEGGVELGVKPDVAARIVAQTLVGAAALIEQPGSHPEAEIDRVTTPGGITIKGLNAMEAHGFTTAVIEGLKASLK